MINNNIAKKGNTKEAIRGQLNQGRFENRLSIVNKIIIICILFAISLQIIETDNALFTKYILFFKISNIVLAAIFTIEFLLNLYSCGVKPEYAKFKGKIKYLTKPRTIIDIISISAFYFAIGANNLLWARNLRILKIFSIARFAKFSRSLDVIISSIKDKKAELFATLAIAMLLLIVSSTLMYLAERNAQPEHFSSIFKSLWWSIITLTAVGYGDVYPITAAGKILASCTAIIGIGFIAMPTGILAATFAKAFESRKDKEYELSD